MTALDLGGQLCGLKGCHELMVPGAYFETNVDGVGVVRVGICMPHHDLMSLHTLPNVSISDEMGGARLATLVGVAATLLIAASPVYNPGAGWVRLAIAVACVVVIFLAHSRREYER